MKINLSYPPINEKSYSRCGGVLPKIELEHPCNPLNKFDGTSSTAAYFHPSFCAKNPTKKLSNFLDFVIANPKLAALREKKAKFVNFEKIISSCMTPQNCIGSGSYANVYRIDDKYCFKHYKTSMLRIGDINMINKPLFKDLKTWDAKGLVMIGNVVVMKNANPKSNVMPAGVKNTLALTDDLRKYYNEEYLPKCAKMPQQAFDDLAADFNTLNRLTDYPGYPRKTYTFDTVNPNNFLHTHDSIKSDSIRVVDDIDLEVGRDLNNLSSMLNVFLLRYNLHHGVTCQEESLFKPRKEILKKCLLACEKSEIPLPSLSISNVKFSFKLAGLSENWMFVEKKINELRETVRDSDVRVKMLSDYFDTL